MIPEDHKSEDEVGDEQTPELGAFDKGPMKPRTSVTKPLDAGDRVPTGIEQAKKHLENALSNLEFYQDTHAADDI